MLIKVAVFVQQSSYQEYAKLKARVDVLQQSQRYVITLLIKGMFGYNDCIV